MLTEIMNALDNPNGVEEDIWVRIVSIIGDTDPVVKEACCLGGRWYLTEIQSNRLKYIIPFHIDDSFKVGDTVFLSQKCSNCNGPFHPATGHAFNQFTLACHVCYGKFAAWQLSRNTYSGSGFSNNVKALSKRDFARQERRLKKKELKAKKAEAKADKLESIKLAKAAKEYEERFGKPRQVQFGRLV